MQIGHAMKAAALLLAAAAAGCGMPPLPGSPQQWGRAEIMHGADPGCYHRSGRRLTAVDGLSAEYASHCFRESQKARSMVMERDCWTDRELFPDKYGGEYNAGRQLRIMTEMLVDWAADSAAGFVVREDIDLGIGIEKCRN